MVKHKLVLSICCSLVLVLSACSRQQSDWQKTREANSVDAYEHFLKKYPSGEFTAQAQARVKELYEERDWQKARDADTPEAYQAFLKQYPEGKWTEEARIRVENFTLAQAPAGNPLAPGASAQAPPSQAAQPPATAPAASVDNNETAPPPTHVTAPPIKKAVKPAAGTGAVNVAGTGTGAGASSARTGTYAVQLGAYRSGAHAAKAHWQKLQQLYPVLLAGLSSKVVSRPSGGLYRLQAVGLSEKRARDVCASLKAKSQPCIVVPPA
ncbi:MAG: hypothetical protein NVSMB10_16240 [Steroidobacteraceae bacterium]